jgi:uncharacterized membrane protein
MGERVRSLLRFALVNFGPLLAFYAGYYAFGLLGGIAAGVLWVVAELAVTAWKRERPTRLFVMTAALTVGFGAVDLLLQKSVLFRYESVITNVLVGAYFGSSLRGPKTLIQEFYERSLPAGTAPKPHVVVYLRGLTVVWTAYFFVKAAVYGWLSTRYPLEEAMAVRGVVGPVSFGAMFVVERVVRGPVSKFAARRGWLGPITGEPEAGLRG